MSEQFLYINPLRAYQRAIDLLKYIISLSPAGVGFFPYICDTFWQVYDENSASIRFSDVSDVLGMIVVTINERAWTLSDEHSKQ